MSKGLYRPGEFKDNCGFGLMAHMQGQASHDLLEKAIEALACMTHRGGIAADGKTGDGCGLLMQKPDSFLRTVAQEELGTELGEFYAVGMVFLPRDTAKAEAAREAVNTAITNEGLGVAGWRVVPTDDVCLGPYRKGYACLLLSRCLSLQKIRLSANLLLACLWRVVSPKLLWLKIRISTFVVFLTKLSPIKG